MSTDCTYSLMDGERQHRDYPDSFFIPCSLSRYNVRVGMHVKVGINVTPRIDGKGDRLWFKVIAVQHNKKGVAEYVGICENNPIVVDGYMRLGGELRFQPQHVLEILENR